MIEYFPQIDCVCLPSTTMSRRAPTDSLFDALKKQDIGAFGIKPFAAGSLFAGDRAENLKRARLAIRYILATNTVIPIPGVNSMEELDNVVTAVKERRQFDLTEQAALETASQPICPRTIAGLRIGSTCRVSVSRGQASLRSIGPSLLKPLALNRGRMHEACHHRLDCGAVDRARARV